MKKKEVHFPISSVRICIDEFEEGKQKGRIYGIALEEERIFNDISDLVVKIDSCFNEIGQPQPSKVLRSFSDKESHQPYVGAPKIFQRVEELSQKRGQKCTLDLVLNSRQQAEWQGFLRDVDGNISEQFHSSLECIRILEKYINHPNVTDV